MASEDRLENAFDLLAKPIRKLIERKGFLRPTEPQEKAIPRILEGKNVLLISPTATGKTEAAFLPILSSLISTPDRPPGIKVVYITPLRALNRDLLERLEWWCNNLDVRLAVRHGDTEANERLRQARSPPDVLITTPETLQALLIGRVIKRHLSQVKCVIVDEVHELADNKRGSQLSLALERLRRITGRDFQVVGLSATVGTQEKVARFLVGIGRDVEVVKVPVARYMRLQVLYPEPEEEDLELAASLFTHPEVAARLRVMREYVEGHRSALLFTNTRSISEVLTSRFKVWDVDLPISIHHGSLAKPSRVAAERGLKDGDLKALVCTSSLELGLDVGRIDLVIQYMSPRQVTRLIQRVGRSGHSIGRTAEGVVVTMDSDDALEAMVICRRALKEELEPVDIPYKPYDVLTHQIAGLLMQERRLSFDDILYVFKRAYPYADLSLEDVKKALEYMHNRSPRLAWASFEDMVVARPRNRKALYGYYFENLSMIPDEKQYLIVDAMTDSAIGIVDEAFVAEYGRPGVKFIIRGSPWQILAFEGDRIYVKPVDDPTGAIPSWIGEEIPVPFEVAQEVGRVRALVERRILSGESVEAVITDLSKDYSIDVEKLSRALCETIEQVKMNVPVPTDKRVILERWGDFVIISSHFGSLTNRALAQLIGHIISERVGYAVVVQHDPYRIFIQTAGTFDVDDVLEVLDQLKGMPDDVVKEALARAVAKTGLFKRRMIHVARRFGALEKWVDFSNVSLRSLVKSFEGTIIYEEALKETFEKDLDVNGLINVLNKIKRSEMEIVKIDTRGVITPIARVGIERVSMKTDLIPPERLKAVLIESAKARLLSEVRTFICVNCWDYLEMIRMKDLPDRLKCPKCGSNALGALDRDEEEVYSLVEKRGEGLTKAEEKLKKEAMDAAKLIIRYGKPAAVALTGRGLKASDVVNILDVERKISDSFFELIIEAERRALKRKWQRLVK